MKVGVVLIIEGSEQVGFPRYREVRERALLAEQRGFDSLWVYDHFLFRGDGSPVGQWESLTFLAALAEATERIGLGTLVAATPFRNPAVLVKIATALDEISAGRFVLGVGTGWNQGEFDAFGFPFDRRVDRFEETLKIIAPLLREGRVDFQGEYARAVNCEDLPRGPRPAGPPLMVGASGPRMLRLAAQYADWINTGYSPDDPTEQRAALDAACRDVGRDPATLTVTTVMWAAFPDLGRIPDHMKESTYASVEAVAERLRAYQRVEVAHVMVDVQPNNEAALERLGAALRLV
ncbi:MAG TPA: LLM class flavin-dependent oxidoreductase [Ardenticatenaceae bacterium]|nr:LLM class flavin-dependent oxidoreductase [Ardenticatenaceae bacterium]